MYLSAMADLENLERRLSDERIKLRDGEIALLHEQMRVVRQVLNDTKGSAEERIKYLKTYLAE